MKTSTISGFRADGKTVASRTCFQCLLCQRPDLILLIGLIALSSAACRRL